MLVVSSREFRDKQKNYLDKADEGEEILIQRGKSRSYKVIAISDDDTLMSKEEFFEKIDRALQEAKQGKGTVIRSKEELKAYFDNL
jgi:major membrane immunogen (membrane-anchored lipoprotein)